MSAPKRKPAPRGERPQPEISTTPKKNSLDFVSRALCAKSRVAREKRKCAPSGSDHSRSHIGPSWGTSCFLSIARICIQVNEQSKNPNVKFKKPDLWLATPGLNRRGRKKHDRPQWRPTLDNQRPRNTSAIRCYCHTCADIRRKTRILG
jgi:hypothetical protein